MARGLSGPIPLSEQEAATHARVRDALQQTRESQPNLSVPDDLVDAARIDGMSEYGIVWSVMAPAAAPQYESPPVAAAVNAPAAPPAPVASDATTQQESESFIRRVLDGSDLLDGLAAGINMLAEEIGQRHARERAYQQRLLQQGVGSLTAVVVTVGDTFAIQFEIGIEVSGVHRQRYPRTLRQG